MERQAAYVFLTFAIFLLTNCGASSNINKIFVTQADKDRLDHLLQRAQMLHDDGNYRQSLSLTEKIMALTPNNEQAVQLKAFNELALAGFAIFDLISKIAKQSLDGALGKTSSDTADILKELAAILNISDADLSLLATKSEFPQNNILKDLTVYIPQKPGTMSEASSPRGSLPTLLYLSKAIKSVCPFMADSLLSSQGEATSERYSCEKFQGVKRLPAQPYLIFFAAHFIEVLYFNSILLYSSDSEAQLKLAPLALFSNETLTLKSNLFKRIDAVEQSANKSISSFEQLDQLTEALTEVTTNVQAIFDTTPGSMLYEMMADLSLAVSALDYIEGLPQDVTKEIKLAVAKIEAIVEQADNSVSSLSNKTSALKQKLGDQMVSKLNSQVETYFTKVEELKEKRGGDLSLCQKAKVAKMCDSVDNILADLVDFNVPVGCNNYRSDDYQGVDTKNCQ